MGFLENCCVFGVKKMIPNDKTAADKIAEVYTRAGIQKPNDTELLSVVQRAFAKGVSVDDLVSKFEVSLRGRKR